MDASGSVAGIDVSKARLDVAARPADEHWSLENSHEQFAALADRLLGLGVELVVLEATGGLETPVACALTDAGLSVAVVNPRQVRDFAKATGRLAKTDRIDADVIAHFGQAVRPVARPLPDDDLRLLKELVARRRQLIALKVAETNRRKTARSPATLASIDAVLGTLKAQVAGLQADIERLLRARPDWCKRAELLSSAPGIGMTTAAALIAELPELGDANRSEVAALAGLAPLNHDSGTLQGRRSLWGGRATVRSALYMGTLVATRHNPIIAAFYRRLLGRGKPKKVALAACMRKLLTILNAMIRSNSPWRPTSATATNS